MAIADGSRKLKTVKWQTSGFSCCFWFRFCSGLHSISIHFSPTLTLLRLPVNCLQFILIDFKVIKGAAVSALLNRRLTMLPRPPTIPDYIHIYSHGRSIISPWHPDFTPNPPAALSLGLLILPCGFLRRVMLLLCLNLLARHGQTTRIKWAANAQEKLKETPTFAGLHFILLLPAAGYESKVLRRLFVALRKLNAESWMARKLTKLRTQASKSKCQEPGVGGPKWLGKGVWVQVGYSSAPQVADFVSAFVLLFTRLLR